MTIWLPPSHVIHQKPPKFACTLCPAVFTEDERHQFERHCLSHTQEELAAHSPRHQAPGLFDPEYEGSDVDWGRWVREHAESDPHGWDRWGKTDEGKSTSGLGDG